MIVSPCSTSRASSVRRFLASRIDIVLIAKANVATSSQLVKWKRALPANGKSTSGGTLHAGKVRAACSVTRRAPLVSRPFDRIAERVVMLTQTEPPGRLASVFGTKAFMDPPARGVGGRGWSAAKAVAARRNGAKVVALESV